MGSLSGWQVGQGTCGIYCHALAYIAMLCHLYTSFITTGHADFLDDNMHGQKANKPTISKLTTLPAGAHLEMRAAWTQILGLSPTHDKQARSFYTPLPLVKSLLPFS